MLFIGSPAGRIEALLKTGDARILMIMIMTHRSPFFFKTCWKDLVPCLRGLLRSCGNSAADQETMEASELLQSMSAVLHVISFCAWPLIGVPCMCLRCYMQPLCHYGKTWMQVAEHLLRPMDRYLDRFTRFSPSSASAALFNLMPDWAGRAR